MNIGVLRGGKIREHDSHLSAAEILADLRLGEYKIIDITIDQNGDWYERGIKTTPHQILPYVDVVVNTTKETSHVSLVRDFKIPKLFEVEPKIPQAGLAIIGETKGKEQLITKILEEYEKAINWYKSNQKDASELVVKTLPMLEVNGLADSIDYIKFENINAQNSKKDLEFFFSVLLENDSKIIGGKLPDDNFYYK